MSTAAVAAVGEAQRLLSAALDEGEAPEIRAASQRLAGAVAALGEVGAWHDTPELRALVRRAMAEGEAARIRTNYLAESTRERLARVQSLTAGAAPRYGRHGRYV